MPNKVKGLSIAGLLVLALGVQGCARSAAQEAAAPTAASGTSSDAPTTGDCDALPLAEKEACYARYDEAALAECERVRLYACAPYARMHKAEMQLKQINDVLLQAARKTYASYEDSQPGYVKDVEDSFAATDQAWRAYRDAQCNFEPFIQGMSRQETAGLTESCRARKTEERVGELMEMKSALFAEEETNDERKQ